MKNEIQKRTKNVIEYWLLQNTSTRLFVKIQVYESESQNNIYYKCKNL